MTPASYVDFIRNIINTRFRNHIIAPMRRIWRELGITQYLLSCRIDDDIHSQGKPTASKR